MSITAIEWADCVWNVMVGCTRVPGIDGEPSGCDSCYAESQVHRFGSPKRDDAGALVQLSRYDRATTIKLGNTTRDEHALTFVPTALNGKSLRKGARWTGAVWLLPDVLDEPLHRRKPSMYFVNSISDVFHQSVVGVEQGRRFVAAMFGVMALTPHIYMILSKRDPLPWFEWMETHGPGRLLFQHLDDMAWESPDIVIPQLQGLTEKRVKWPLPNVWIGRSVSTQPDANKRIPELIKVPAAVRFLSIEPLLRPVVIDPDVLAHIDWVIIGGESGGKARPMHPQWVRDLIAQCVAAGVAVFFKQWGEFVPCETDEWTHVVALDGTYFKRGDEMPASFVADMAEGRVAYMRRVGKGEAGREIDGRTWDEFPKVG